MSPASFGLRESAAHDLVEDAGVGSASAWWTRQRSARWGLALLMRKSWQRSRDWARVRELKAERATRG